ncbi:YraN family protein [Candidatus Woesebacteria bacterium]|nr:YraN family protein [Candidatus Woesebacteria bacterium]
MKQNNLKTGNKGEHEAADYLEKKGYEILERNYREKYGEIDIVARCKVKVESYIVFVEVKTKTEEMFGEPWEMINKHKIKQITQMGHLWCIQNHYHGLLRIDAVGVWLDQLGLVSRVEHWENVQL